LKADDVRLLLVDEGLEEVFTMHGTNTVHIPRDKFHDVIIA
jgi:hypothetical protein